MPLGAALGLITGIGGAVSKLFGRKKANRALDELLTHDPTYQRNKTVDSRLGLASTLLNSRMPGAATVERNIYGNQANQFGQINRNATDASQAIAAAAGTQAGADQAFNKLGLEEEQDYQRRYGNFTNAQESSINEDDKVYQDQVRKFGVLAQIRGAQSGNNTAGAQDVSNLGFGLADFGLNGGFSNFFGRKKKANAFAMFGG